MDISACVEGVCLDAALPFLLLQSSLFLHLDQLLPETKPSTITSRSLNSVAVLLYIYIIYIFFIIFWSKTSNISRIVIGHQFACTRPWKRKSDAEVA